jgi:hypothetical protein
MFARLHVIVVFTLVMLAALHASPVLAQTATQGRVLRDNSVIWRSDAAVAAGTAKAGTLLTITAQSELWYEVLIPGRDGERGVIARSQVQLLPGSPAPPERALRGDSAPPAARGGAANVARSSGGPAAGRRPGARSPFPRAFIAVNGAYRLTANDFEDALALPLNAEIGRFETKYAVPAASGLAFAGGAMFSRSLGVGVALSRVAQKAPGAVTGDVPHPFFFRLPRRIAGDVAALRRDELAVHIQARGLLALGRRIDVAVFGGPSFFRVEQAIVRDVAVSSSYPYDEARFVSATTEVGRASRIGFNAGSDVALFMSRHTGVGFGVTYSRATADAPAEGGRTVPLRIGGVSVAAGLRLRF